MKIHTVWGVRKGDDSETPELITAWDEHAVDNYPEGFQADVNKGLASWGDDLLTYRHVVIDVPIYDVWRAFQPLQVDGSVD